MKALDMSGVDPLRWAEVRERVAVVVAYLTINGPTEDDRMDHAARLGLGRTQFLKLVRAWRAHETAVAIAGAKPKREKARTGWRALPPASEGVMRETLERLGPDVRPSVATAAVTAALKAKGLQSPDRSTVWRRLMAIRRDRGYVADAGDVVVAECRVRLPVLADGTISMPSLLIAARASDGRIAAALPLAGERPDMSGFAKAALAASRSGCLTADRAFAAAFGCVEGVRQVGPGTARTTLSRVVGRRLGRLELQFNRTSRPVERLLRTEDDRPLDLADARLALENAIAQHNEARGGSRRFRLL
ncbi:hypothetical protein [Sphingomonas sp. CFBP 13733]|uniref:hypothetical protein n=1 Tax=Sphingomonas sp. CFBP 13733 TaxID=2775291 RepID=UPI001780969F|nr:hypothetical protein [Sphingomonas sp. CFBP 13733]MBD8640269.1 hypothetical protein [Sphingomonas sp. CFBP 13733]